jgi:excisionase family DNA binding protein
LKGVSGSVAVVPPDLADRLRQLAEQLGTLGAGDVIGALESIKFEVWTATVSPTPPTSDVRPPLTVAAVAQRIGYSKDVVYDMLRTGELRNVGRGRHKRVSNADVEAWLARPRAGAVTGERDVRYDPPGDSPGRRTASCTPPGIGRAEPRSRANPSRPLRRGRQYRHRASTSEPDAPGAAAWRDPPARRCRRQPPRED